MDAEHGEAVREDELPDELKRRETRVAAIEAAKTRLEAEQRGRGRQPDRDRNRKGPDRTSTPSGIWAPWLHRLIGRSIAEETDMRQSRVREEQIIAIRVEDNDKPAVRNGCSCCALRGSTRPLVQNASGSTALL